MGEMVQTKLEDFSEIRESKSWQEIEEIHEHNRLAMKRIHRNHVAKMSDILNEAFSRLFDADHYIRRV